MRNRYHLACLLALQLLLAGCGWATGGIFGLSSDGGSGSSGNNATPNVSELTLQGARTSPATLGFLLTDNDGDPVDVGLFYSIDGSPRRPVVLAPGEQGLQGLQTSTGGVRHERRWDYDAELGSGFRTGITITVEIVAESGRSPLPEPAFQEATIDLGNDPPTITDVRVPAGEIVGLAAITMTVGDSSSDFVTIDLDYDLDGDEAGFLPATPVFGTPTGTPASPSGTAFTFVWDVVDDEGFSEDDVTIRLTPRDGDIAGAPVEMVLRIDNNTSPSAILDSFYFLNTTDRTGGIPLPFTVFDGDATTGEPGDDVRLVFQWRKNDGTFPDLPANPAEIEGILADPVRRKALQIATERPRVFEGLAAFDATQPDADSLVRLPELLTTASQVLRRNLQTEEIEVHGELEILRPGTTPRALMLSASRLENPVGAVPSPHDFRMLVLDGPASGGWRIRELDVGTRKPTGFEVSDPTSGRPTAMTREGPGDSVLVASDRGGTWQIQRADKSGITTLFTFDGTTQPGSVRGILALGTGGCLVSLADSLVRLRYPSGEAPLAAELFSPTTGTGPLQTPWGIAVDPLDDEERVFVAENGADRILAIDLSTLEKNEVVANGIGFPRPECLAFEANTGRLLVVTDENPTDGHRELRALGVRHPSDLEGDGADAEVFEIQPAGEPPELTGAVGSLATGPEGLRVLTLTDEDDLAIGGGVEQVRTIVGYEHATQTVRVSPPFSPPFRPGSPVRRWRIRDRARGRIQASPEGTPGVFLWDSGDIEHNAVVMRLTPYDSEAGTSGSTGGPKEIFPRFGGRTGTLGSTGLTTDAQDVRAGDLDQDGDLDLVVSSLGSGQYVLFFQTKARTFGPGQILGDPARMRWPSDVELADLDCDGDLDIAATFQRFEESSGEFVPVLAVFFQISPGCFGPESIIAQNVGEVEAADFDSDGDIDLVSGSTGQLQIFLQTSPATFAPGPVLEGGCNVTAADIDSDGRVDLLCSGVQVYYQTSPGVFTARKFTGSSFLAASGDVDGDGDLDIVTSVVDPNEMAATLNFFLQSKPREFEPGPTIERARLNPSSVSIGDLDGDGRPDLLAGDRFSPQLTVYSQSSPLQFALDTSIDISSDGVFLQPVDIDADGALDILSANNQLDSVTVYFNRGGGDFDRGPTIGNFEVSPNLLTVAQGDFDGDSDLDLVSGNLGGGMTVFLQGRPGEYEVGQLVGKRGVPEGVPALKPGDLDGDGDLDLVAVLSDIGGPSLSRLGLFFRTAPGTFVPGPVLTAPEANHELGPPSLADLDGDGDLDIVSVSSDGDAETPGEHLAVFLQTAPGSFAPGPRVGDGNTVGAEPFGIGVVEVADLDDDGDLDLVALNRAAESATLFFQVGPATFEPGPTLEGTLKGPVTDFGAFTADLDANGRQDVILLCSLESGPTRLSLYRQTSPGSFAPGQTLLDLNVPAVIFQDVALADLDADGDLDLGISLINDDIRIYDQVRPAVFEPGPVLGGGNIFPAGIFFGDYDGDGDTDLSAPQIINGNLAIFFGSH